MQALEGEEAVVRDLFARISKDTRHHHVLTLAANEVPARQFPDWSMGFQNLCEHEPEGVPGYKSASRIPVPADDLPWKESIAVSLLATFMKEN